MEKEEELENLCKVSIPISQYKVMKVIDASRAILRKKNEYLKSKEIFKVIKRKVLAKKSHSYEKMISEFKKEAFKTFDKVDPYYLTLKRKDKFILPSLSSRGQTFGNQKKKKFLLIGFPRVHLHKEAEKKRKNKEALKFLKVSFNFITKKIRIEKNQEKKKTDKRKNKDKKFLKKFAKKWKRQASKAHHQNEEKQTSPMKKMNTQKYISKYRIGILKTEDKRFKRFNTKSKNELRRMSKSSVDKSSEKNKKAPKFFKYRTSLYPYHESFNSLAKRIKEKMKQENKEKSQGENSDFHKSLPNDEGSQSSFQNFSDQRNSNLGSCCSIPRRNKTRMMLNQTRKTSFQKDNEERTIRSEMMIKRSQRNFHLCESYNPSPSPHSNMNQSFGFFSKIIRRSKKKKKGILPKLDSFKFKKVPHSKNKKAPHSKNKKGSRWGKKKVKKRKGNFKNDIANNPLYLYNYSSISLYVDPRYKPIMANKNSQLIKSFNKR